MQNNEILLEETESKGRFYVEGHGSDAAELTFSKAGSGLIIIDHTSVPDAFRGTGMGDRLVEKAVEHARKTKVKILPLCPFAKSRFPKHPDWADVLN